MRNLLALFAFLLLVFVGVGWFLDWYQVRSDPAATGHQNVNIDINGTKIIDFHGEPPPKGGPPGVYAESGSSGVIWVFPRVQLF